MTQSNTTEDPKSFGAMSPEQIGAYFLSLHESSAPVQDYQNLKVLLEQHLGELLTNATYSKNKEGIERIIINCPDQHSYNAMRIVFSAMGNHVLAKTSWPIDDTPNITTSNQSITLDGEHANAFLVKMLEHVHFMRHPKPNALRNTQYEGAALASSEIGPNATMELLRHLVQHKSPEMVISNHY